MGVSYNARVGPSIKIKEGGGLHTRIIKRTTCPVNNCVNHGIELESNFCAHCGSNVTPCDVEISYCRALNEFCKINNLMEYDYSIHRTKDCTIIFPEVDDYSFNFDVIYDGYCDLEEIEKNVIDFENENKNLIKKLKEFFGEVSVKYRIVSDVS